MIERLANWLSRSRIVTLRRLFSGFPPSILESDPSVQRRIIEDVERSVYGTEGIVAYEQRVVSGIGRAARRSLAQHLGQRAQYATGTRFARTAAFAVLVPVLVGYILLTSLRKRRPPGVPARIDAVVFFWAQRLEKFVWEGMFPGYRHVLHRTQETYFGLSELWFVIRAIVAVPRIALYPDLVSNLFRWTAYYGYVRIHYRPRIVAHFFESTASCSLMTAYLHEHSIRHCDIQHGELRFNASCAFAEFDWYRLWGEHSCDLLSRQYSPRERMEVIPAPFHRNLFVRTRPQNQPRPPRLLIVDAFLEDDCIYDPAILKVLRSLTSEWQVRLRRHPTDQRPHMENVRRWNLDPELQRRGVRVKEEPPDDTTIADAISQARVVMGVASAALLEAWLAGCKVLYVPGGPSRDVAMERHGGSRNVAHLSDNVDLTEFLSQPASLDDGEASRVNYVFGVLLGSLPATSRELLPVA